MHKKFLYIFILVLSLLGTCASYAEVVDKIVVVVNNEVITQGEIDRMLGAIYQEYARTYTGDALKKKMEDAQQKVVEQLIDDRLILSEAKKLNIEISGKDIDARISEVESRFESKEKFEETLAQQHLSLKDLRARYKEQLMTKRLIDQRIGSKIAVTPVELSNYYNSHIDKFMMPEEIKPRNILIKPSEDPKKALELANNILARIREGSDFAELAKVYSEGPNAGEGGLMGYIKKGDLLPEIEKVVFELNEQETSGIIQTSVGYHIFKVEEKKVPKQMSLSEARNAIEEILFQEKVKEKIKGWVEGLKKNAYIAFK